MNRATEVAQPTSRTIVTSSIIVASGTLLSRVTGLVRVLVTLAVLGGGKLTDIYTGANNMPNIVFELLLGGVLTASIMPIFVKAHEDRDQSAVASVFIVAMTVLVIFSGLAIVAAPALTSVFTDRMASGTAAQIATKAQARELGILFVRVFMPQMLFYGITAIASAALNARRRFVAAAYLPILNNLVVVAAMLWVRNRQAHPTISSLLSDRTTLWLLAVGTTAGIAITAITFAVPLARNRVPVFAKGSSWRHPAIRRLVTLSGWTVGYVVSNQLALSFVQWITSGEQGTLTYYTYAFIFFQLPHGLIAVSIMTTVGREMTSAAKAQDTDRLRTQYDQGLRYLIIGMVPAAAGFIALARPITDLAVGYGNFTSTAAHQTSIALQSFAFGLVPFSVYLYTLRVYYAHGDARTPFRLNCIENVCNIAFAAALFPHFGLRGLAIAYSLAYFVGAAVALRSVRKLLAPANSFLVAYGPSLLRAAASATAAALFAWIATNNVNDGPFGTIAACAIALVLYAAFLMLMKSPEFSGLRTRLAEKRSARM